MTLYGILTLLIVFVCYSQFSNCLDCDYFKYQNNGCDEKNHQECNRNTNICECKYASAVKINDKCLPLSAFNEKCYATKQCLTSGAKCLTSDEFELKDGEIRTIYEGNNTELVPGYCHCSNGQYFNRISKSCEVRILGSKCGIEEHCSKIYMYCDKLEGKCRCLDGYFTDIDADSCHVSRIRIITSINNVETVDTFVPGPMCHSWDPISRRCRDVTNWENARSWSSFIWKLGVLCVILILLMLVIGSVQRIRHNENLAVWGRAMEPYNIRSNRMTALRASRGRSQFATELGCMVTRDAHIITLHDDPPPYEEAVAMSNRNCNQVTNNNCSSNNNSSSNVNNNVSGNTSNVNNVNNNSSSNGTIPAPNRDQCS